MRHDSDLSRAGCRENENSGAHPLSETLFYDRHLRQPAGGVLDDLQHLGLLEDLERLVAWAKVEHASLTQPPNRAAAEMFAGVPPLFENDFVGTRHVKRLVIHFRVRNVKFA